MSFWLKILSAVSMDEATKAARKKAAADAAADAVLASRAEPASPTVDPFLAIEAHLKTIDQAHAASEADARRAYLDLLARMIPRRAGTAPPEGAHALAVPAQGGPPDPAEVLAVLRAVEKSPDDLRRDVKVMATLRDQADLAAQQDELFAAERAAGDELRAVQAAFDKVEAEWAARIEVQRRLQRDAITRYSAATTAAYELERTQRIDRDLQEIRSPRIPDPDRATPEELAEAQACTDARAELTARALRLGELERVFFPAPPAPEPAGVRHTGHVVYYAPEGRGS